MLYLKGGFCKWTGGFCLSNAWLPIWIQDFIRRSSDAFQMRHDSFGIATWLIWYSSDAFQMRYDSSSDAFQMRHDSWVMSHLKGVRASGVRAISNESCRTHICGITYSYFCHDAFVCVTWRIHTCDMTRSYAWHDSFVCVTWHICILWHDSVVCVLWRIRACDMAHTRVAESIRPSTLTHTRVDYGTPYSSHM